MVTNGLNISYLYDRFRHSGIFKEYNGKREKLKKIWLKIKFGKFDINVTWLILFLLSKYHSVKLKKCKA